jgi:hypothetical protein
MELFDTRTYKAFADGRWAGGLRKELKLVAQTYPPSGFVCGFFHVALATL